MSTTVSHTRVVNAPHRDSHTHLLIGLGIVLAIPAFVLCDTLVAFWKGWHSTSRLDWCVIATMLCAGVGAVGLTAVPRGRAFLQSNYRQLLVLAAALVVTSGAVEVVANVFLRPHVDELFHRRAPSTQWVFHPAPGVMPGVSGASHYTTNSLGIRGPELSPRQSAYRILCVGGSTTECLYLDDAKAWPALLMEMLNRRTDAQPVWVGNAGISSYGTIQHLPFVETADVVRQMDCLVFLVGCNDLARTPNDEIERKIASDIVRHDSIHQPIWRRSVVLELARRLYNEWTRPRLFVEDDAGLTYDLRRKEWQNAPIRENYPNLDGALSEYKDRIHRIIQLCREFSIRPVFLTQPVLWAKDVAPEVSAMFWLGLDGNGRRFRLEDLRQGIDRYNDALRNVCVQEQAEIIDLTSMDTHPEFFYDDAHFNEVGARQVATFVATGLSEPPMTLRRLRR